MKRILIGITILGVGGALVFNVVQGNRSDYVAGTATSTSEVAIEEEVEATYPDEVLQSAQEAENAVLRAWELEQDRLRIVGEMEAKKAEYDLYVKEQSGMIDSIDKELKTY